MYDPSCDVLRREGYKGTIAVFKYLPGRYREGRVFLEVAKRWQVTGLSWKKENSSLIFGKLFHSEVIRHQKRLPKEVVEFPSLGDAPYSTRKGYMPPDLTSVLDLTYKSTLFWAVIWDIGHQRSFLTYAVPWFYDLILGFIIIIM